MNRRLLLPLLGLALGLAAALWAVGAITPGGGVDTLTPNIWAVVAVPLGLAIGLVLAHPQGWPTGLGWSGVVYVFCVFLAARIELLIRGNRDATVAANHDLYFQFVPYLQLIAGLGVTFWLWWRHRRHVA